MGKEKKGVKSETCPTQAQLPIRQIAVREQNRRQEIRIQAEKAEEKSWEISMKVENECAKIGHSFKKRRSWDKRYNEYICEYCQIEANNHNSNIENKNYTKDVLAKTQKFVFPKD